MKSFKLFTIAFGIASAAFFSSCQKENNAAPVDDEAAEMEVSNDGASANYYEEETQLFAEEAVAGETSGRADMQVQGREFDLYARAVITADTVGNVVTVTIDFGNDNVVIYGRARKGKILISYTYPYASFNNPVTVTTQDYYVGDVRIDYNRASIRTGNGNGLPVFSVQASGKITLASGRTFEFTSTRTRAWDTQNSFILNGTTTIKKANGVIYTSVSTDLKWIIGCGHFVSGTYELTRTGSNVKGVLINYGTGNCDNVALATSLRTQKTFTIIL